MERLQTSFVSLSKAVYCEKERNTNSIMSDKVFPLLEYCFRFAIAFFMGTEKPFLTFAITGQIIDVVVLGGTKAFLMSETGMDETFL